MDAMGHQALLEGPYLPTTESQNLPVSVFILVLFRPVAVRGLGSLLLFDTQSQIPNLPFPGIIPFLFHVFALSPTANII